MRRARVYLDHCHHTLVTRRSTRARILRIEPHNPARVTLASRVHALAMYIRGRDELASASSTAASGTPSVVKRRSGLRRSGAPGRPLRSGASAEIFSSSGAPARDSGAPALQHPGATDAWLGAGDAQRRFLSDAKLD